MEGERRRREIIDALRRGTVPQRGLDVFAVGLARFEPALDEELRAVAAGGAGFKALRGEYGSGETFFAHWLQERAKRAGFAGALAYVNEVGALAEAADHHPDIDIRWDTVTLRLSTHSAGGLTEKDLSLAAAIDDLG